MKITNKILSLSCKKSYTVTYCTYFDPLTVHTTVSVYNWLNLLANVRLEEQAG